MTDGSVIFTAYCTAGTIYKLVPDNTGSYVNGTWSQIASLPVIDFQYNPLWYAQQVLPDGRLILNGGEYNSSGTTFCSVNANFTTMGAIYDPVANMWTAVAPPSGWTKIGDAQSIVLANGTYMLANATTSDMALLNISNFSWTPTGTGKADINDEEGWTLLPDGTVLTVDANLCNDSERYDPSTGAWSSAGSTIVQLPDCTGNASIELGPQVLRPDGTVVVFGGTTTGTTHTAIFNSSTILWEQGPDIPSVCGASGSTPCTLADAPAALLPSGSILFAASPSNWPTRSSFLKGTHFFEMDTTNVITQVSDPPGSPNINSYLNNMVVLPNGQVLLTVFSSSVFVYTPTGSPQSSWRPVVSTVPSCISPGGTYIATGTQFNGLSMGASYGDDYQSDTNFPLVQIVNNGTGDTFFARTFNHSTRSVALNAAVTTSFQAAAATETGASTLYVIANGIASAGTAITVAASCPNTIATHDFNGDGMSDVLWHNNGAAVSIWEMNGTSISNLATSFFARVPPVWSIVGTGDFNGDGKSDILWHDTNGNVSIWEMNGTTILNQATSFVGLVPTVWSIVGTGDFNGDGMSDVLWRDTSGNVSIWEMNGTTILNLATSFVGQVPTVWSIVGSGDFNGDGMSDVLWRDTSGNVSIWEMNGTTILNLATSFVGQVPTVWSIVGTGDFNGDGKSDILWRDTNGNVSIWEMNGTTILNLATSFVGQVPTVWSIADGDNGDGTSDVLWHDTNGNVAIWEMNGTTILNLATSFVAQVPTDWSIQNPQGN